MVRSSGAEVAGKTGLQRFDCLEFYQQQPGQREEPGRWRPLIEEFRLKHGLRYAASLPFLFRWIYWRTDFAESPSFLEDRAVAAKILANLYAPEDLHNTTFVEAVDPRVQSELIGAIATFSSRKSTMRSIASTSH